MVDEDVNLSGLNTGRLFQLYSSILSDALQVRVEWIKDSTDRRKMEEVLNVGVKQDARSTPPKKYSTDVEGVFPAGDCRRGQSLIV